MQSTTIMSDKLYILAVLLAINVNIVVPTEINWTTELDFPEGFKVKWKGEDNEHLIMEMQGRTRGYVAVGFSPNGQMKGSDIIMGWVDRNSKGHIKVRKYQNREEEH